MRLNPRSLRGRLLSITLQVLAGGLLLISILFFINTHHEIDELFDAQLAQMARMVVDVEPGSVARHKQDVIPEHRHEYERKIGFAMFDRQGKLIHHSSEVVVMKRPDPCRGFRNQKIDGQRWRLFCYQHPESGEFVVAWQSHHIRNELAGQIVGSILLPLALGLPLLALMIWWSSGKVLSPVTQLSHQIAQRTPRDLALKLARDDAHARPQRGALVTRELVDLPPEQVQLEPRGVERIADLVREARGEGAHLREGFGLGSASLELHALGDVHAREV